MLKFIIFELLKSYVTKEKKCYGDMVAVSLAALSLTVMLVANFYFFYIEDKDVGSLIISSALLLALALAAKIYSCYFETKVSNALPSLVASGAGKIIPYVPVLIRYMSIGAITFVTWNLFKRKLANQIKK